MAEPNPINSGQLDPSHPELTSAGAPTPETPTVPVESKPALYAGKYETLEDWETATRHSEQEGARLANRVRELEAAQQQLAQEQQRVNPSEARARRDPREALNEFGVPADAVGELVQQQIAEYFAPRLAVEQAIGAVTQRRPEFGRYRADVDTWLAGHPDVHQRYNEVVSSNPQLAEMAVDWVFDRFTEDRRAAQPPAPSPANLADAGMPTSQGSGGKPVVSNQAELDELNRSIDYARKYGDDGPFGRLRLRDVLNRHPDLPQI